MSIVDLMNIEISELDEKVEGENSTICVLDLMRAIESAVMGAVVDDGPDDYVDRVRSVEEAIVELSGQGGE